MRVALGFTNGEIALGLKIPILWPHNPCVTVLSLDVLLYLESETEDDGSQTSSESEIDGGYSGASSDSDDDDDATH